MIFCPHKLGLNFIMSKKMFDIMVSFNLPLMNKIPVQVNSFNTEYLLVGFPMIPQDKIDLSESLFLIQKERVYLILNQMMST